MGSILLKDLKIPFIFTLIVMVPLIFLWLVKNTTNLFPIAVFVQLSFTFVIVILSVLLNEQYEDINNGYKFYQALPVKNWHITLVKFIVPVIILVFLGVVNHFVYAIFSGGKEILKLSISLTIIFSVLFLIHSGIVLVGIFKLGYTKFIQVTSGLIAFVVFGSFLVSKLFGFKQTDIGALATKIENWLFYGDHLLFLIIGLIIYIGLGILANIIEKK